VIQVSPWQSRALHPGDAVAGVNVRFVVSISVSVPLVGLAFSGRGDGRPSFPSLRWC
jgi:hypothetical protein